MDTIRINPLIVSVSPTDHTLISPIEPTMHKGGIGKLVSVVAMVAIPFAAPAIATSIGLSSAIASSVGSTVLGNVMASAMAGAALGAVSAAVTGQDIGKGALYGGLAGGIGGYSAGTEAAAATAPGSEAGLTLAEGAATETATPGLLRTSGEVVVEEGLKDAAEKSFMEVMKDTGSAVFERVTDPERLATVTLTAAIGMGATMLVPDALPALTDEEQEVVALRQAELEQLKIANKEKYDQQIILAEQLMVNAGYIDPVQFGLNRAATSKITGARAVKDAFEKANLEGKDVSAGDMARANYRISKDAGAEFAAGFSQGVAEKDKALSNAYKAIPDFNTNYLTQSGALSDDLREAGKEGIARADAERSQITKNLAGLVMTPVSSEKKAQPPGTFNDGRADDDELQKAIGGNQSYGAGLVLT
tara:strand:- start:829 stop:2085 length:1257 start_codon:yes stop_codon:yes gene_type:complete